MSDSDKLTEAEIQGIVRQEISRVGRSVLSIVVWTLLAGFTILIGLQAIQIAFYLDGVAAVAVAIVGILVVGASISLLYYLHWPSKK
ncbi:hypothetical protein OB955_04205 [Halobacteria archaeon AArc-m2/3/4]|uniref:Solute:sodium symporter small subunit n=1 Tax=Natronoglomus mannanivorans TaxID=2979990 RepID=A0ABT2QAK1_9EURY|nr:hypothetical protein [Halobacteria archaeon AArc-m2/3/4]